MAQKLAMEEKQKTTDDKLNEIQQRLISAQADVEEKERQSEDARCQLEVMKTEVEELKEHLSTAHNEVNMEQVRTAELKEKILQLQPREPKSDYCQTDAVSAQETDAISAQELCQLQAEVENLKELLNTAQTELDTEHRRTAELKEKLSELETERDQAYALSEQENHQLPEDTEQLSDGMLNTTQTELVVVSKMNSTLHSSPPEKQLTELDHQTGAASKQVKFELEETGAELEQSREVLHAVVLESKHCQTDDMPDDSDKLEQLQDELKNMLDELSRERNEMKLLQQQQQCHLVDLDQARNEHLSQLTALKEEHSTAIESVKLAHSTEFEHLREEHQLEMEKHAAALEAEYQHKMAEQKAEMESEAQRSVMSLQEELQSVKDEANTVAESMQQTLTSEFENQLATLKLQFEKDLEEMQCRHAVELEQRDASVSDAETILLKKDERIEELEEQLREMQNRLAAAVAEYQCKVAEENAEIESEAQRSIMSLQEELQRMKDEAKTVAESVQETLTSEFEDQLSTLKLQFEKDVEEIQYRHDIELQQRDATVSDAETVLLKKDERIEELEEQLREMQNRLALQSNSLHDQLGRLQEEHQIEMGKSADALEAEYQHKMAEQKAEVESEAQRSVMSLQEELQHVKDEANTVAESMQRKLTSEFENQLDALKLQFEKDYEEMQGRHAKELQQRDATVGDAETVLLKKDEKIEELEEQLTEMQNTLAAAVAEYQHTMSEEKIKVKSEAQRSVISLQEELQHVKYEANTVAESLQRKLTSEFENQLSTLKLQFEKDFEEMQCRHAKELQQRDATVSDAETVLLKKNERIEELEEQLTEMQKKLATAVAEYQHKMSEEKIKVESEAQRSVMSLQEELQHAKDKANTVAESMQRKLTSKFENQLATLKLQFEKDYEEMQCRHAKELQQRDATVSDAETVLLKKDEKIEELEEQLREMQNRLTVQLDSVHSLHAVELQTAETAHREDLEKLNMALTEIKDYKQKMTELEREYKKLTVWADHMDDDYPRLIAIYEEERGKNKEIAQKLEQSSNACSKLKAELEKLQHHKCDDADLRRQLTEEKLSSNALKYKLQKAQDDFDRRLERQTAETARLKEKVRQSQNTIRQLQDAANNTYTALHHPRPEAAAAAALPEQYATPPVCESGGYVEKFCLSRMSAKMSELQKKVELLEAKNVQQQQKLEQYKSYIVRLRAEREELRTITQEHANAKTTSPEAASQLQKECVSADENVEEYGSCTGRLNTKGVTAAQKHTTSDSAEMVDKISDCKHQ